MNEDMAPGGDNQEHAGTPPVETTPPATSAEIALNPGWATNAGLDPDKAAAIEKKFSSVGALAKSYANLEGMFGREKVPVLRDGATPEEVALFRKGMGVPDTPDAYEVNIPEALVNLGLNDPEAVKEMQGIAHELNLTPQQFGRLQEWYFNDVMQQISEIQGESSAMAEETIKSLQQEWGPEYTANHKIAEAGAAHCGFSPEFLQNNPQMSNNPEFVKAMHKVGTMLKESPGAGVRGGQAAGFGITNPAQARAEIKKIYADKNHPYFVGQGKAHDDAQAYMEQLFKVAYPEQG